MAGRFPSAYNARFQHRPTPAASSHHQQMAAAAAAAAALAASRATGRTATAAASVNT